MRIINSHFHWLPKSCFETLAKRTGFPRAEWNARGGYTYIGASDRGATVASWAEWYDLDRQFEHMDGLGHQVDVVCSMGPFSIYSVGLAGCGRTRRGAAMERGDGGGTTEISGTAVGQCGGAAAGYQKSRSRCSIMRSAISG